ncbi:DUF397 domain-containing protein, partial [Nocardia sp. CC201C]
MNIDQPLKWRKSTKSGSQAECVEVAELPNGGMAVRDSKDPSGPMLRFTAGEWDAFIAGAEQGEF